MNTTFIITGGAGRVVTSIPALEKYERLNPDDDFNIIVHGWEALFYSHPTLQKRVIGTNQKNTFDNIIKNTNVVIPDPYQVNGFFNQRLHIAEAFDQEINKTDDHNDLNYNCLYLSTIEIEGAKELIDKYKSEKKMKRAVVFQPYGSGVNMINGKPLDRSNRSLLPNHSLKIIQEISKSAAVINASLPEFRHQQDKYSIQFDDPHANYFRRLIGLIYHCDYFVGCCSVGQHIARALNKSGLIIMGATDEKNYSYTDHFTVIRKHGRKPCYAPWRLSDIDVEFADRENDGIMDFDQNQITDILKIIKNNINDDTHIIEDNNVGIKYD